MVFFQVVLAHPELVVVLPVRFDVDRVLLDVSFSSSMTLGVLCIEASDECFDCGCGVVGKLVPEVTEKLGDWIR